MKKDIETRDDVVDLVNLFYGKVRPDKTIGFFFSTVMQVEWEKHLPVMVDFWQNIIFHSGGYTGNPMRIHMNLHGKSSMKKEHFQRWLQLFVAAVNELFEGEKAEQVKQRALSIATVMQSKIAQMPQKETIY